jgi:hypothetical protein
MARLRDGGRGNWKKYGVFEEDDTTFCFPVILELEASAGLGVGAVSEVVYSAVFTSMSAPNWERGRARETDSPSISLLVALYDQIGSRFQVSTT